MVGGNCFMFGCSSSWRKSGVTIFKVPQRDNERSSKRRKSIKSVVTKDPVIHKALRDRTYKINLSDVCKVSCNSGRQAYYKWRKRLSLLLFFSLEQLCEKTSLNFVKT